MFITKITSLYARLRGQPGALRGLGFGVGLAMASSLLLLAMVALSLGAASDAGALGGWSALLTVNFGLIAVLAGVLVWRIRALAGSSSDDNAAPRMHLRFAGFLSLAAIVPAIIVAVFLGGVFVRTIDGWFSERIGATVNAMAEVARASQNAAFVEARETLLVVAGDLNNPDAALGMVRQPVTYRAYLDQQAALAQVDGLYVINDRGTVLASAERVPAIPQVAANSTTNGGGQNTTDAPGTTGATVTADATGMTDSTGDDGPASSAKTAPTGRVYTLPLAGEFLQAKAFTRGEAEEPPIWIDRSDGRLRALAHLDTYPNAYLYFATPPLDPNILASLTYAELAFEEFQFSSEQRRDLQHVLVIAYIQMTALIVLGAAWLGLRAASKLVRPIGQLVRASERLGAGDLSARVELDHRTDEMAHLARTFNQTTQQLSFQRDELIKATAIAENRREFIETVLAGVSAGVINVDPEGQITLANASALDLLAAAGEADVVGQHWLSIVPEFSDLLALAGERRGAVEGHIDLERGGEVANLRVRAGAAHDGSGGMVVTFDDVTSLISAQRSAAWRDVARRIAHEIKNPLTPIQLSAERLRRKYAKQIQTDEETFVRCVSTILHQVNDIRRMVDEFSGFARMPAPRLEATSLAPLVRETVFAQRVAAPQIDFPVRIEADDISAVCDVRLVGQALTNVLKNAVEALTAHLEANSGDKAAKGMIECALRAEHNTAMICVRDNGPGWPLTRREQLLEPYITTRAKGTGLGLAIVKRIMEDHKGRLELDDRGDGQTGAVVRLVLPLAAADGGDTSQEKADMRMAHGA